MKYIIIIGIVLLLIWGISMKSKSNDTQVENNTETGETQTVTVGPQLVDCVGVAPQKCMIVDGTFFYDQIQGFEFEAGYEYVLEITQTEREIVPADANKYMYALSSVVSKTKVSEESKFQYSPEGTSWNYDGGVVSFKDGRYNASFGCNQLSGTFTTDKLDLTFGPTASTRKACRDPEQSLKESNFSELIVQMKRYEDRGESQVLVGGDKEMLLEKQSGE